MHQFSTKTALPRPRADQPTYFYLAHDLHDHTSIDLKASLKNGLRTPPADDMGTAYQYHQSCPNLYDTRSDTTYATTASGPQYNVSSTTLTLSSKDNWSSPPEYSGLRDAVTAPSSALIKALFSPQVGMLPARESTTQGRTTNNDAGAANLRIPSSISKNGGSLADLAAQITCLFWFESMDTLRKAEHLSAFSSPVKRLRDESLPSSAFRKWVVNILSRTLVSQNVVLLALLFIYRLKSKTIGVKGRIGSEYRLLTVALMLGNKFLDDNTYTNKTWAEVSGICVSDIHVMEVEFLSNMRYSLLASKEQWEEWQVRLGHFWRYCDQAARAPFIHRHALTSQPTQLPSPPASSQTSPPTMPTHYIPNVASASFNMHWPPHHLAPQAVPQPPASTAPQRLRRKRSISGDDEEPIAKRMLGGSLNSSQYPSNPIPLTRQVAPRLPVPKFTLSTNPIHHQYDQIDLIQHIPVLPPLKSRSLPSVNTSVPAWVPQLPTLTPTNLSSQPGHLHNHGYVTPTRKRSPNSAHELLSLGSSPISATFAQTSSPSIFLQQRASPYKPVRHVNTLLYPLPPAAALQDVTNQMHQMHYQTLGKRNEYRSGVLPYAQFPQLPRPNIHAYPTLP